MKYSFTQIHAINVLVTISVHLYNLRSYAGEIIDGVNRGKLQHCKARRQGLELAKEIDKYISLACKITTKYLDGVNTECYKSTIDLSAWMKYGEAVKSYFQN